MGNTLIKVDCVDQRLIPENMPVIASGGQNEDRIEFNFCSLWDGFEKTAVFYRDADKAVYHIPLVNDACVIPHEVLADAGWMYFGVFGVLGDARRTSGIAKYRVEQGAITSHGLPSDPTSDIYTQYLAQVLRAETAANNAESATKSVNEAVERANTAAESVAELERGIETAERDRVTAEGKRVSAESARASAETTRVNAEKSRVTAESSRASAETKRVNAETARVNAETARANAETSRATAETNRVSAEKARAQAEAERASAESARVVAEEGRVAAEKARVQSFTAYDGRVAKTERSLNALWKLNQGISYQFEADDAEAYQKIVPSGAKCANVDLIGGKTVAWNQQINPNITNGSNKGLTAVMQEDGSWVISGAPSERNSFFNINAEVGVNKCNLIAGHKYCMLHYNSKNNVWMFLTNIDGAPSEVGVTTVYSDGHIFLCESVGSTTYVRFQSSNLITDDASATLYPMLVDLTQMGLADVINSVDDFKALFPTPNALYNPGELVSAEVESIRYDAAIAADIPDAIRALPGYGWSAGDVYNSIERTETGWQYVQRVGSIDIGGLSWVRVNDNADPQGFYFYAKLNDSKQFPREEKANAASIYTAVTYNDLYTLTLDKALSIHVTGTQQIRLSVKDNSYNNATDFKSAMSGVMLYYELDTPIITDITDLMGVALDAITVEAGGMLVLENAAALPVPNTVEYAVSLAEVVT